MFEHIRKPSSSSSDLTPTPNQPIARGKSLTPQRPYSQEEAEKEEKFGFNAAKILRNEKNFSETETEPNDTTTQSPETETENTEKAELQLKSETEITQPKDSISDIQSAEREGVTESSESNNQETENTDTEKAELQLKSETEITQPKDSISESQSPEGEGVTETTENSHQAKETTSKPENKKTVNPYYNLAQIPINPPVAPPSAIQRKFTSPELSDEYQQEESPKVNPVLNRLNWLREEGLAQTPQPQPETEKAVDNTIQTKGIESPNARLNQENDNKIQLKLGTGEDREELESPENIEPIKRKQLGNETNEDSQNKEKPTLSPPKDENNQTNLKSKKLPKNNPDVNQDKQQPETQALETKKLDETPSDSQRYKEQLQIPEATPESESLKPKKLDDTTPQLKSTLSESPTEGKVENLTGETGKVSLSPPSQPLPAAPSEIGKENAIAKSPIAATPTTTPATPTTEGGETAISAPAIESGGGATSGEVAGETEEDGELAEVAATNENVELDSGERDAAMASLAEDTGGGAAPTGGGGGAAIADKPTPTVPNVSGSDPSAALAAVANLPPAQLQTALGGVSAAVGNTVGKEKAELAANPPQMESPSSATVTKNESATDKSLPEGKTPKTVEKAPVGETKSVPQPPPLPLAAKPNISALPTPQVTGNAEGKLDSGDAQKLQGSLRNLPTKDSGLQQVSPVSPPPLELAGDADPKQAQQQREKLEKSLAQAQNQGQEDIAQPMGENEIYPQVKPEKLQAEGISGGGGSEGNVAAAVGAGVVGDDAVSIIAQQQKGAEIQAAVAQAQSQIATQRQSHSTQVAAEKAKSNQEIANLQTENAAQQAQEKAKAQGEVTKLRGDWQKEQDELITKSRSEANEVVAKGNQDVTKEQTQAEKQAAEHIKKGEKDADVARKEGEAAAEKERQKGEEESGGILGWLADKAKAFCEGIKQAIQKAFEVARAAVKAAIEGAQKLATAAIELGRKAIVGIIKTVGNALIAIGDKLLGAFPGLRDRFRNAIKTAVKAAETAVNTLANTLKKGVQTALNLLGKGLNAALGLLEKGMIAAVDIANGAVQGAIKFADAAIKALGAFAVLVKDISGNPAQWLSNLGAGATDGIKNHFWGSFQTAVKEWFSQKVEEVLGLGMTVWNVLKQGGINVTEVSKMAWEGIKSAIPAVLIQILIEKVVSMIVPAAGTVMLIIQGLQAAWGTASRILQAFERFMVFLKAVKTGQAGPPFGAALAAAGVVVIDFVANWLLKRLRGAASKVAGKVREIAAKIGSKIKGKLGKVKDKFFGKKKGDKGKGKEGDGNRSSEEQERKKREKWQRAFEQARQALRQKLHKGLGRIGFYAVMTWLKIRYGFKKIQVDKSDKQFSVKATFNPTEELVSGKIVTFDYTEEGMIKGSKPYRQGVLNQLGLQHTAKGHDPSIPDQTLANNARMQGGSGKWLSHRAMIEAGKLAKAMYPDPNPGEAYFIPIPPGWAKGYRRVNQGETIEPELYVLQDEGGKKQGVIEVNITQARVFFNDQKNVRSVHPYAEGG